MRPTREAAFRHRQFQFNPQRRAFSFHASQRPVRGPYETMRPSRLVTLVHRLDALRVAVEHAKPWPAHRHAGTNAFAFLVHHLIVGPDDWLLRSEEHTSEL